MLDKLKIETVKYLNLQLKELNNQGILYIKTRKCNFDVEIGIDMLRDFDKGINNFILWSGDSDFADPIRHLLKNDRRVSIFATVRKIASELNELRKIGLHIFDIRKIRDFICWPKEMKSKRDLPK